MRCEYEIVIWWSDEDDAFIVDVPEIPGCTAHGPTWADAAREIQVAMSLWIETCEEFGMEDHMPPEPMGKRLEFSYIWHPGERQTELDMSRKYELVIYWSRDDETYIAEIPELSGCSGRGDTYVEAVRRVQSAMDEWIDAAKKDGRKIPEPRTRPHFVA